MNNEANQYVAHPFAMRYVLLHQPLREWFVEKPRKARPGAFVEDLSAESVRGQLNRVLQSETLSNSPILTRLLRYVVEQAIQGKEDHLKEYSLGVEVFERGESFDPKTDTIVRVHARRLRAKLEKYYGSEGHGDPIVIEVPKGHYVPVFRPGLRSGSVESGDAELDATSGETRTRRPRKFLQKRLWPAASLALLTMVLLSVVWWSWYEPLSSVRIESIAVLPLENLSGDPAQEYFVDGMTDALISSLSRIGGVRVISRTSAMQYKRLRKPLPEIAKELGVQGVVEGTVLRIGDRVRITVQLIEADSDHHLWSGNYERDVSDVLSLQSEVAREVIREIRVTLTSQEEVRLTPSRIVNAEAHEAFLKGRYHLNRRAGMKKAFEYFNQAIEFDPNYALAYAGLADCYVALGGNQIFPPNEAFSRAKTVARKALEIDGQLGEAHTTLAAIHTFYDWDWSAAEKEFRQALELAPNYAQAHQEYAEYLTVMGRFEEAVAEANRAVELDPLSLVRRQHLGSALYLARQYDGAIAQLEKAIGMFPESEVTASSISDLARAYVHQGRVEKAVSELQEALLKKRILGSKGAVVGVLGYAYAMAGQRAKAFGIIDQLVQAEDVSDNYVLPYNLASIYAALGENDQAFRWLDKSYKQRVWLTIFVKASPAFDPLRSDRRYWELLRKMNLED